MANKAKKFWSTKNVNNTGEITMYGPISESSWWGDEITPKQFADDLNALGDVSEITVRINSGGGDVFAGMAIHSMLTRHKASVTVYVDGLAASIASIIAMAGDRIVMPNGAMMMIHNPWSIAMGDAGEFRQMADVLDKIRDSLVEVYADKTGIEKADIIALLDAETWMSAADAVEKGFATEIEEKLQVAASLRGNTAIINGMEIDWGRFAKAPKLPEAAVQASDGPAFGVGSRIQVAIDTPHMEGQSSGEVREAVLTWVYGVVFDGMEEMGVHKWYVESELQAEDDATDGTTAENGKKKKKPMQMPDMGNQRPVNIAALKRQLEIKSQEV